jgi:hypothetical protein
MEYSASLETLQARIRQPTEEGLHESDADLAVPEYQLAHFGPLNDEEPLYLFK